MAPGPEVAGAGSGGGGSGPCDGDASVSRSRTGDTHRHLTRDSSLWAHVTARQHTASVVTGGAAAGEAREGTRGGGQDRFTFLEPLPLNPPLLLLLFSH